MDTERQSRNQNLLPMSRHSLVTHVMSPCLPPAARSTEKRAWKFGQRRSPRGCCARVGRGPITPRNLRSLAGFFLMVVRMSITRLSRNPC